MASISSLSSSSSSSIYGTRNVISGLASGMDTEAMIENAVQGYKTKITQLGQQRTKLEWQQEAYRSIISKMVNFSNKYTSYSSNTNLLSASFFNNAVTTSTAGKYKDLVSASGKTSSDVQILGVKQLATAATYTVSGIGGSGSGASVPTIEGGALDLLETQESSKIAGSLTIKYGGDTFTLDFKETDIIHNGEELAKAINDRLAEETMLSEGSTVAASTRIQASYENGKVKLSTVESGDSNSVWISGAGGNFKSAFNIQTSSTATNDEAYTTISTDGVDMVDSSTTVSEYLAEKEITFNLDGISKSIKVGSAGDLDEVISNLNRELADEFGAGKITVSKNDAGDGLSFSTQKGSTLAISNGAVLGLDSNEETSYVSTSQTLGDILGTDADWSRFSRTEADGAVKRYGTSYDDFYYLDSKGHRVKQDGDTWYRVDDRGEFLYDFEINGEVVGSFGKNTTLESVLTAINSNADANVSVSFSKLTNQFKFTADETGAASKVEFGDGLASALFSGGTAAKGQDAIFSMTVNGEDFGGEITRSSNSFEVDGLTINLKGTFNYEDTRVKDDNGLYLSDGTNTVNGYESKWLDEQGRVVDENGNLLGGDSSIYGAFLHQDAEGNKITDTSAQKTGSLISGAEAVTFNSAADSDKIVDAIKSMVEDYNAMVTEIKNAYSTLPEYNSSGDPYEPLTDADKEGMSETTIENYEEKAKTGLLFGDRDLSSLYNRLRDAIQMTGQDGADLSDIGITTSYSGGLTTLSLDENKLRSALEADPDKVTEIFTKSKDSGSSTDGLMQTLKVPLDMYAKTTGGTKGILIEKAGSPLAPTSIYQNTLQTELDDLDTLIEKWEEKLSDKIDYYNDQFTQLELLIQEMNAQSSSLYSLMSGY